MEESKKLELREKILERSVEVGSRIIDLEELTKPISPDKGLGRLTRLEALQDEVRPVPHLRGTALHEFS